MEQSVKLKRVYEEQFDNRFCIICQSRNEENLVSTENDRRKVIEAVTIRNDEVKVRLHCLELDEHK